MAAPIAVINTAPAAIYLAKIHNFFYAGIKTFGGHHHHETKYYYTPFTCGYAKKNPQKCN